MTSDGRRAALGFRVWDDETSAPARDNKGNAMSSIQAIVMPKWGLVMEEGMLARWSVEEGAEIAVGQEIMDIETSKIANAYEALVGGVLRKKVVSEGQTVPVGALLGVVADGATPAEEIDAFVADFLANFKGEAKADGGGPQPTMIEAGGRRLRHLRVGPETGAPVIFVHGFGGDYLSWAFNQGTIAETRPAYAVDLPGHGGSTKDVTGGTLDAFVAALADYHDAIGGEPAHFVGHSLGGHIMTALALTSPQRVRALTLIAPAGFGKEINGDFISGFIAESRPRKLRPVLEMLVANPGLVTAQMVEDVLKYKRLDGAVAALQTVATANFDGSTQRNQLRSRLGEIGVPIQVIWSEADQILPIAHADGLPSSIKVSRLTGAGHIPHIEKSDEVNALIAAVN
jgi:pyruvate dehydrogenase E2 component (dihydrolipoamide acetyltransferase)